MLTFFYIALFGIDAADGDIPRGGTWLC